MFISLVLKTAREKGLKGMNQKSDYILYQAERQSYLKENAKTYPLWLKKYFTLTKARIEQKKTEALAFPIQAKISVIMPVYKANLNWLEAAIVSLENQIYTNWELCIADDASGDLKLEKYLQQLPNRDDRIKVFMREQNGHISEASNSAIAIASGDWYALLDQDDVLAPDALYEVVKAINDQQDIRLIYSDEDKLYSNGTRSNPYHKPDFNYHLFLAQNMISHLGVYEAKLVMEAGGFREGYEGSQDWDLALRCIELLDEKQIFHIPKVLYHWRIHEESTSTGSAKKPFALTAAAQAISDHLERINRPAEVLSLPIDMFRVKYTLPMELPEITLIIPTKNNGQLLKKCLTSILELSTYPNYLIYLIDNGSDDPETLSLLNEFAKDPRINLHQDSQVFNFSAINNQAVKAIDSEYIAFINDDIEVISPDWLEEMLRFARLPETGAVGAKLYFPNDTIQHAGIILGIGGIGSHAHKFIPRWHNGYFNRAALHQEFSAVTAACLLLRKDVFLEAGAFDEEHLSVSFNDVDLCLRIRELGYRITWTPFAELYHHESASRGEDFSPEKRARFKKEIAFMESKWSAILLNDPAYSPNLSLLAENFDLSWPPRLDEFMNSESY